MKKLYAMMFVVVILSSLVLANGVMNFVPANANFVLKFKNNAQNYDSLKKVEVFSFLLNDLGIENLIQSSVSQTAVSIGTKPSQIWNMTENDFVIFASLDTQNLQSNVEIALKGKSKILLDLLSSLVGGNVGSEKIGTYTMKTFETNGVTIYALDHDGYVLLSNSPHLLTRSIQTYDGKYSSFTFSKKIPSDSWFSFYTKLGNLTENSTLDMIPTSGYGYAQVKNGELMVTGISNFEYKDVNLKKRLLSFNPNAKSLQTMPSTGNFWLGADVADPVEFYDLMQKYAKDFGLKKEKFSLKEGKELAEHFSGKLFMDMDLSSQEPSFVVRIYLSKDLSEYIPTLSKDASATFTWNGHTVLRDDTREGTRTSHTFTIFYPDKVVISDLEPQKVETFIKSPSKAEEMGNFSSFEKFLWSKSFLIGYVDLGDLIKSLLQYPLTSGALFQMKFDEDANLKWQLLIK